MKTTERFENAIKKLYIAFHNNKLHPECCKQCAVGNILDNRDMWKHLSDLHGDLQLNYVGKVHQSLGRRFNGYTPQELLHIEVTFLKGCGYSLPLNNTKPKTPVNKDIQFNGLYEVVKYLCALDDIPNVMDYSKLFEFEGNTPIYQL